MATFGEKLKAIRLNKDMSQEDLAKILKTTKQSISRYETETNSPRIDTVADIAEKLGFELSLLINDKYSVEDVLSSTNGATLKVSSHYVSEKTKEIANAIAQDRELGLLFDAAKDASSEDLRTVHELLKVLKVKEKNGN